MIDTHSHIYLPQFRDREEVLFRACEAGITDIVMPAINIDSLPEMELLAHPDIRFHKMVGVHPCEVDGSTTVSETGLHEKGASGDIVALGETGLDYYWSKEHVEEQKKSLRKHCSVAKALRKPVILHNRESTTDLLDIMKEEQDGRLTGIWHCFNGTIEEAFRALDLGFYLGIGGVVTFKNAGVDQVVKQLPIDRLLLETDAPYLAPVPKRGQRNEPSYMKYTAAKVAELHKISLEELDRITSENAHRLFGLT